VTVGNASEAGAQRAEPAALERIRGRSGGFDVLTDDLDARLDEVARPEGFADLPIEVLAQRLKADMQLEGRLVVTTAASLAPANTPTPSLADTG